MFAVLLISGVLKPSVSAFNAIVSGPLSQFLSCSSKIGGDVQAQVCLLPNAIVLPFLYICTSLHCCLYCHLLLHAYLRPLNERTI